MSYSQRVKWERQADVDPTYIPKEILSTNSKTGTSLNLPVINCKPSKNCAQNCYACSGPISWKNSIRKSLAINAELGSGNADRLINESRGLTNVRLCGSGDLSMSQVPTILKTAKACPQTRFWGFTRKLDIAKALHDKVPNLKIIVSIDASSKDKELKGYNGPMAFGPKLPGDEVPNDKRIMVVFPVHIRGKFTKGVSEHKLDCPTSRGAEHDNACEHCQRCWDP